MIFPLAWFWVGSLIGYSPPFSFVIVGILMRILVPRSEYNFANFVARRSWSEYSSSNHLISSTKGAIAMEDDVSQQNVESDDEHDEQTADVHVGRGAAVGESLLNQKHALFQGAVQDDGQCADSEYLEDENSEEDESDDWAPESDHSDEDAPDGGAVSNSSSDGTTKLREKKFVCQECGITVKKPALLTQHMRSHSDQKPFVCPERGCSCAYKRKDHLNRHLKNHQGVLYFCPQPGCDQKFTLNSNLQRHLKQHNGRKLIKSSVKLTHICSRPDCGKAFKYPSLLRTHELQVHEKPEYAELVCLYPGCGDNFTSAKALVAHARTAHPYLLCEVCGETIPGESFLRHVRTHGSRVPREVVCPYDGCGKTYSRESNLRVHVRSVHLNLKPFICSHEGCNRTYAHKAARDRHEQFGGHSLPRLNFQEQDELLLSRPRGGRKPVAFDKVETYLKKRRVNEGGRLKSAV